MSLEQKLADSDLTHEQRKQVEGMVKGFETYRRPLMMCKGGMLCIVGLGLLIAASILWVSWIQEYTRSFETASCVVLAKRRDVWRPCSRVNDCPRKSTGVYTVRVTPDLRQTNQGSKIEAFEKSTRDESASGDRALYDSIAVGTTVNCYQAKDDPEIVKLTEGRSAKLTSMDRLLPLIIVTAAIFVVSYAAASNVYQVFGGGSHKTRSIALDSGEEGYSSSDE
eukprot:TRINITY_DN43735_c0_g1_i1.p1 TRINITY_DN43735_c0_g1~~TRINITY_DN43735_c0_g1_i1.p1  ORF type:complete len:223 (+),score=25.34 TRINITY_DN43735_c0_g1_i1:117-785(+)